MFEKLVAEAIDSLPDKFLEKIENVDIVVEAAPSPGTLKEFGMGRGTTLFGLYRGIPLKHRGTGYGSVLPDIITIYQNPIEMSCRNGTGIKTKIREVLMHEIGHHFGMNEDEMEL